MAELAVIANPNDGEHLCNGVCQAQLPQGGGALLTSAVPGFRVSALCRGRSARPMESP